MKRPIAGLLVLVAAVLAGWLALAALTPGPVVPASAPAEVFSAERALDDVEALAAAPRPMGTEAHERARDHVVRRLVELGLEARVQEAVGQSSWGGALGTVHNVMARIPAAGAEPGDEPAEAVLLMTHYDSVPTGPGAADAASGVALLLEVARALLAEGAPQRDVILLFTDGEEAGLLGADAFHREHPWADAVAVVLNFEARGSSGPSLMFETGADNAWLIRHLAATGDPEAASYSYEIYRRMPNDTDYTVFRRDGVPGLNFAFIGDVAAYHSALDTVDRLDPRSLQQQGSVALELTRSLAAADLEAERGGGDAVYFNPLGLGLVHHPASWTLALTLLLMVAAAWLLVRSYRGGRLGVGGLLGGVVAQLLAVVVVGGLGLLLARLLVPLPYDFRIWGDLSSVALRLFGLVLALAGVFFLLYRLARRWLSPGALAVGGLLLWTLLTVAVALVAPGASYLFTLPLGLQIVALFLVLGGRSATDDAEAADAPDAARIGPAAVALLALAAVGAAVLWIPFFALVIGGLQAGAAVVVAALAALVLALLSPQVELVTAPRPGWLVPTAFVVVGLVVAGAALASAGFGPDNPRGDFLVYAADADTDQALWVTRPPLDPWLRTLFPESPDTRVMEGFVRTPRPLMVTAAPDLDLVPPQVEVLGVEATEEGHRYRLRLRSPRDGDRLRTDLVSLDGVGEVTVAGQPLDTARRTPTRAFFAYYAPPPEGIEVVAETGGDALLELRIVDQTFGLPAEEAGGPGPRPAGLMPVSFGWDTDSVMVMTTVQVEPDAGPDGDGESTSGDATGDATGDEGSTTVDGETDAAAPVAP